MVILNSRQDLCNQTVIYKIVKMSSRYSEYFYHEFDVLTEISVSNLECTYKCAQTCRIFHAYGPWAHILGSTLTLNLRALISKENFKFRVSGLYGSHV